MGIQLILQGFVLIDQVLRPQLLVLDQHLLAFADQMDHITTACHNTGDDKVTQRMQIMMHHRIDGRDIDMMMQEDKPLP